MTFRWQLIPATLLIFSSLVVLVCAIHEARYFHSDLEVTAGATVLLGALLMGWFGIALWRSSSTGSAAGVAQSVPRVVHSKAEISTDNTVVPRYIAAVSDNALALTLSLVAAKVASNDMPLLQLLALVATYLGYYLLSEGLWSRTPGKLLTGLTVVQIDGQPCSWRQVFIRTGFRVLEVNPVLLGAVPAALCIVFSKRHQRFGDKLAHTAVVPIRRLRDKRTGGHRVGP